MYDMDLQTKKLEQKEKLSSPATPWPSSPPTLLHLSSHSHLLHHHLDTVLSLSFPFPFPFPPPLSLSLSAPSLPLSNSKSPSPSTPPTFSDAGEDDAVDEDDDEEEEEYEKEEYKDDDGVAFASVYDFRIDKFQRLGGLGKTTLAQLIFNHERVVNHFEQRIWVCVSEDFSLKRMAKSIIESATGQACADLELDVLLRKLMDLLQRKRYLLVLDDVWDDEQENWQRLKSVLECGGNGSSVLVTTRVQKVAAVMGTVPPHELSFLSDNEVDSAELVVIGKEIIKKCGGASCFKSTRKSFVL